MKFTPRRDQRRRTTFVVRHHLTGAEVVALLCQHAAKCGDSDTLLTATKIEEIVRAGLRSQGVEAYLFEDNWDRDLDFDDARGIAAWALTAVRRLYPAVANDPDLVALAQEYKLKLKDRA